METYYQDKIDYHQKEFELAMESNKEKAMKYHKEAIDNYKALLQAYKSRMGKA